ncbi:MAG TPA: insulinase family protein [Anaeromyxobacteraceae bacterium]|nr:insulinase family protein [Anaeromyxobacteraceae bacterium]
MHRSRPFVVAVALAAALASSAASPAEDPNVPNPAGPAADVLPLHATEKTLPNGLKVIVLRTGFPNLVSIQIVVQAGSRNELEPGKSGFAHFFEHMMFRGTKSVTPEQYQHALTQAGARSNAYTTDDFTCYYMTFAKEDLGAMLRLEADRFQNLSYSEADFRTESRAVLGEYNKNSATPIVKLAEVQRDAAFDVHPYKHTTMGFLRDIEDMPNQFAYSRTFFERFYRPEYTTVIVAGDVDPSATVSLVEKEFGGWKRGSYRAAIPAEPPHAGPRVAHVAWASDTLPWVTVAARGPAFSATAKDFAAFGLLLDLAFGETSEVYRKLVEQEQKVDALEVSAPARADEPLFTVAARLKRLEDAPYVRDEILRAMARARAEALPERTVAEAASHRRYALSRTFDNTAEIAASLARYVRFDRSFDTLNQFYRTAGKVTASDLLAAANRYLVDERLAVTTLSPEPMPASMSTVPPLASFGPPPAATALPFLAQNPTLPQVVVKLAFRAGSAFDPPGKEGLAALTAAMLAKGGSRSQRVDEIAKALFPVAGSLAVQVDKELTTFTAVVHRDNWKVLAENAFPQIVDPGFREDDFRRLRDQQLNALTQNLRNVNEEELAKERLQENLFAGTPYGHPALGTASGIRSLTLDDVKAFARAAYTQGALIAGVSGAAPEELLGRLRGDLGRLPAGPGLPSPAGVAARRPDGIQVEIVEKETRATAISFGTPIAVTRAHPDFAALSVAKAWLGEHRSSQSHLFQRIRELRGMNYGDYAYIEAFPRGMFQVFPDPNLPRRAQIFEVWIRPVVPENAPMALRIALYELGRLVEDGLSQEEFERTREYLMKNVFLLTATQDQQLGYAIDSTWYGIPEFTAYMRERLARLTRDEVNAAIRRHFSAKSLSVVMVAKDAAGLRRSLLADSPPPVKYVSGQPKELAEEDRRIGAMSVGIDAGSVRITPVADVFR